MPYIFSVVYSGRMGFLRRLLVKGRYRLRQIISARRLRSTRATYLMNPSEISLDYMEKCVGHHVLICSGVHFCAADTGSIGDYTYMGSGNIYDKVYIGKFCSIAQNVTIGPGEHYLDRVSTYPVHIRALGEEGADDLPKQQPTRIGNDVWCGNNAVIMQGVSVGDGAVIAAGCIVTKDVPPYAIMVGCPGRVLRYRHPENIRQLLQQLQWWDKDVEWLRTHRDLFYAQGSELEDMLVQLVQTEQV